MFFLLEWRGGKLEEIERSLQKSRPSVIMSVKVMLVCNVFPQFYFISRFQVTYYAIIYYLLNFDFAVELKKKDEQGPADPRQGGDKVKIMFCSLCGFSVA